MKTQEKIALVTGAGSGIGRETTLAFIAHGYRTVLSGRRMDKLRETIARAPKDRQEMAIAIACDVSDAAAVDDLFQRIESDCGRLDVLFNNAGTFTMGAPLGDISPEQWKSVIDVNLTGSFLCARAAFNLMRGQTPQGGRIINNGSISAYVPRPGSAPYTASKHAITGLTKSTALDGRPFNIACGQIDVGNAASDMTAQMSAGVLQADGSVAAEPTMDARHVAGAVLHMASLPLDANILFMTVMATNMPYVGRG
jgi:NAD(P)-dependent dehydrogenase (short-subunit alcohol dehydrogenase family)